MSDGVGSRGPVRVGRRMFLGAAASLPVLPVVGGMAQARRLVGVFEVDDYGAAGDGVTDSGPGIQAAIDAAIASGAPAQVVFSSGRYLVGTGGVTVEVDGATNLALTGQGASTVIVVTNPRAGGFRVSHSAGVTVSNLAVDYDPVPFTQGTVSNVNHTLGTFDLTIDAGFPLLSEPWFAEATLRVGMVIVQQGTDTLHSEIFLPTTWAPTATPGKFTITAPAPAELATAGMQNGSRFVMTTIGLGEYLATAFDFFRNTGVTLSDVTNHASPNVATLWRLNDGMLIDGLTISVPAGSGRLLTTNADGINNLGSRGQLTIQNCDFAGMGDDNVNIHSRASRITSVISATQIEVRSQSVDPSSTLEYRVGDVMEVFNWQDGRARAEVALTAVTPTATGFVLTLASPVPGMVAGSTFHNSDVLFNLSACGQGFLIQNNSFADNRGQIRLRSRNGTVQGNTFRVSRLFPGVMFAMEPDWAIGPTPKDIDILSNQFIGKADAKAAAILSYSQKRTAAGVPAVSSHRIFTNLTIGTNTFTSPGGPIADLRNVANTSLTGNVVTVPANYKLALSPAVHVRRATGVTIDDLEIVDPNDETYAGIHIDATVAPGTEGVQTSNLAFTLAATSVNVRDDRTLPAPAGRWRLNEGTGTVAQDATVNNNDGVLVNGAGWGSGIEGQAVVLDGTNDYVSIADAAALDGMNALTVSVWFTLAAMPGAGFYVVPLGKDATAPFSYRFIVQPDGGGHFTVATTGNGWYTAGTTATFGSGITTGGWHHLVGTYDGSTVRVYLNGVLAGTGASSISGPVLSGTGPVRLGAGNGSNIAHLNGRVDEVALYHQALTAGQVDALHNLY